MLIENPSLPFLNCLGVDDGSLTLQKLEKILKDDTMLKLTFFVLI